MKLNLTLHEAPGGEFQTETEITSQDSSLCSACPALRDRLQALLRKLLKFCGPEAGTSQTTFHTSTLGPFTGLAGPSSLPESGDPKTTSLSQESHPTGQPRRSWLTELNGSI